MVSRRVFGLVAVLLLLVDDDKAEVFKRSKHRAACSDRELCTACFYTLPLIVTLADGKAAVQYCDVIAEIFGKSVYHLRRQRDLGHKKYGTFSAFDRIVN